MISWNCECARDKNLFNEPELLLARVRIFSPKKYCCCTYYKTNCCVRPEDFLAIIFHHRFQYYKGYLKWKKNSNKKRVFDPKLMGSFIGLIHYFDTMHTQS